MKQKLFNLYFFLFFFVMINREFVPFKMDLRIFVGGIGCIILLLNIKELILKKAQLDFKTIDYLIIAFFMFSFLSNIMWLHNNLKLVINDFMVIFISYAFNFLAYLVFRLNKEYITLKKFERAMLFAILFLALSIGLILLKVDIQTYLMSGYKGYVKDLSKNFLGGIYRYGGLAEDPNYTSLFAIFGLATHVFCRKKQAQKINIIYMLLCFIIFLLSASKTVLLALPVALIICLIKKGYLKKLINRVWMPIIIIVPILFVIFKLPFFASLITMSQRITMWEYAVDLFKNSPIIGNGFTAFRSYAVTVNWWYVQCHSTIFQLLCETGIISLGLIMLIFSHALTVNHRFLTFMTILFSIFMITTETAYQVYFIFILAVLPIIVSVVDKEVINEK